MTDRGDIVIENELLAGGFVQVPKCVIADPDLSAGAKVAYATLLWFAWKLGGYPGHDLACTEFGLAHTTLRRHLRELQDAGYVTVRVRGLGQANTYTLHDPLKVSKNGHSTCPDVDIPPVQKRTERHNDLEVVLDVNDEYESDSLWITSVAERYGTSRRDRAALRTSLSKYPLDAVKWAVEELQGGMAVKNPGAWLNVVVPELATQLDRRKREKISVQERRLIAVRSTYGFYLQANSPEKARALVEADFGVEAVRQALESAA